MRELFSKFTMAMLGVAALLPFNQANAEIVVGDVIGIDFQNSTDMFGDATGFNILTDLTANPIADGASALISDLATTGGTTLMGVDFELTNLTGQDTNPAVARNGNPLTGLPADAFEDVLISNDASVRRPTDGDIVIDGTGDRAHFVLSFSGLDDTLTYDLFGGFDDSASTNFDTIYQVVQPSTVLQSGVDGVGAVAHTFTGLETDGSGNLVINVIRQSDDNGRHVTVSGLTLTAVGAPVSEPSSLALLGLGICGLVIRRRK